MTIGVLGSGLMGGKVVFSYSRERSRLGALAKGALGMALSAASGLAAEGNHPGPRVLTPQECREDVAALLGTFSEVHPNLYFHASAERIAAERARIETQFDRGLTVPEFYQAVDPLVHAFGDKHTRLYPPDGTAASEHHVRKPNYRWRFDVLPGGVGYLDFVGMDRGNRADWDAFLKTTFTTLHDRGVRALIVDLRKNGGGDSQLGDDLLNYLTDKPYHPVAHKTWRLSHRYLSLVSQPDLPKGESEWKTFDFPPVVPDRVWPLRYGGKVCFLIGPDTFSSAVILANSVQDSHLAPLIGEETPPCNQFGEVCLFHLPHSNLVAMVPSAQLVRSNGDAKDPHGVLPDIVVPSDPDAPGGDQALAAARRWAG